MNSRAIVLSAVLASFLIAGCLQPGPAPTPSPTPAATPALAPKVADARAYEALERELAAIPELNASDVEKLLTK